MMLKSVAKLRSIPSPAKVVSAALWTHNLAKRGCVVTHKQLAQETGYSVATIKRSIDDLRAAKIIVNSKLEQHGIRFTLATKESLFEIAQNESPRKHPGSATVSYLKKSSGSSRLSDLRNPGSSALSSQVAQKNTSSNNERARGRSGDIKKEHQSKVQVPPRANSPKGDARRDGKKPEAVSTVSGAPNPNRNRMQPVAAVAADANKPKKKPPVAAASNVDRDETLLAEVLATLEKIYTENRTIGDAPTAGLAARVITEARGIGVPIVDVLELLRSHDRLGRFGSEALVTHVPRVVRGWLGSKGRSSELA